MNHSHTNEMTRFCPSCFPESQRAHGRMLHRNDVHQCGCCDSLNQGNINLPDARISDGHGIIRDGHGIIRGNRTGILRDGSGFFRKECEGNGGNTGIIRQRNPNATQSLGQGYFRDPFDARDLNIRSGKEELLKRIHSRQKIQQFATEELMEKEASSFLGIWNAPKSKKKKNWFDLRETGLFSPIENQGILGSCTAHAVVGLIEYLHARNQRNSEQRADSYQRQSRRLDLSRMFLYYNARRLLGWEGDTGCYIRTTIKATGALGLVPEINWPYDPYLLDTTPDSFCYSLAANYRAVSYVRVDTAFKTDENGIDLNLMDNIKLALLAELPVAIGFFLPNQAGYNAMIEVPKPDWKPGNEGHAVLIVGYDDEIPCGPKNSKGAFIIRNSWGTEWGEDGYGYLPYEYFQRGFVVDCWTILNWQGLLERFD